MTDDELFGRPIGTRVWDSIDGRDVEIIAPDGDGLIIRPSSNRLCMACVAQIRHPAPSCSSVANRFLGNFTNHTYMLWIRPIILTTVSIRR